MDLERGSVKIEPTKGFFVFTLGVMVFLLLCLPYRLVTPDRAHEQLEFHPFYWKIFARIDGTQAEIDVVMLGCELLAFELLAFFIFRPFRPDRFRP